MEYMHEYARVCIHIIYSSMIIIIIVEPVNDKTVDLNKLRLTIRGELTKKWSVLGDSLENDMKEFPSKLYEKDIITKGTRKEQDYKITMDAYINSMELLTTVEEYDDHCSSLLLILADIGGPANKIGNQLKESWKSAVKEKCGIDFLH